MKTYEQNLVAVTQPSTDFDREGHKTVRLVALDAKKQDAPEGERIASVPHTILEMTFDNPELLAAIKIHSRVTVSITVDDPEERKPAPAPDAAPEAGPETHA